jgi:hypothetical protein
MPTSLIDSLVFRDIFGTDAMRRAWSEESRTQRYLDIEAALARAQFLASSLYIFRVVEPEKTQVCFSFLRARFVKYYGER